ncbi:MAG: oxygenase MpaB family protein [Microbacteriaceae bacterium]
MAVGTAPGKRLSDIAAESVLILGGARAILLQLADPRVGHGVAEHSDFSADPLRRLRNTLTYVYVLVYGDEQERRRIAGLVNRSHHPVRGAGYSAADPELQLWVAATLYDTAMAVHERVFGPLGRDEAEAVYRQYSILGTALQLPDELWPTDRAAFRRYWSNRCEQLHTDEATRRVAENLLHPENIPLWVKALLPLARLLTAGLLAEPQRALYGLAWSDSRQRRFDRAMRLISTIYPRLPRRLRHWPKNHYLRVFRAAGRG